STDAHSSGSSLGCRLHLLVRRTRGDGAYRTARRVFTSGPHVHAHRQLAIQRSGGAGAHASEHRSGSACRAQYLRVIKKEKFMKWITRERVKVDRVACPWLISKFIDPDAQFYFVPADQVASEAARQGATPFDVEGVELGHHGKECAFEAILKNYNLRDDAALVLLGKIVNGADTDNTLWHQPEGPGLKAIAEGFRHLGFKDD